MKDQFVFVVVSTSALLLLTLTICTTQVSARTLYDTCEEAGCEARNLSCCYDDGEDDDFDDRFDDDYDRRRRRINNSGYYCCNRLASILGVSFGLGIPAVGCIGFFVAVYICNKCQKRKADSRTMALTNISVSHNQAQPAPRNDFLNQMDSLGASLTVHPYTKSDVTTSFDLYPSTSTSKPNPVATVAQKADDDKPCRHEWSTTLFLFV